MVIVDITLSLICFMGQCHHALIGNDTPKGEFTLAQVLTKDPGYSGDVLMFDIIDDEMFAIHRVWLLRPQEKRRWRLNQNDPKLRKITKGCVNVDEEVYKELVDCCSNDKLLIR